jgi:hypothetical protein
LRIRICSPSKWPMCMRKLLEPKSMAASMFYTFQEIQIKHLSLSFDYDCLITYGYHFNPLLLSDT